HCDDASLLSRAAPERLGVGRGAPAAVSSDRSISVGAGGANGNRWRQTTRDDGAIPSSARTLHREPFRYRFTGRPTYRDSWPSGEASRPPSPGRELRVTGDSDVPGFTGEKSGMSDEAG